MKKWYIVTTVHGKESAVAEAIKLRAENAGNTAISDVLVPKEWRLEYRGKNPDLKGFKGSFTPVMFL